MAGESIVQVNSGSGPKVHSYQRTIGANNVEDTVQIPGEHYLATYSVQALSISGATTNDHMLQIMAGSSLNVAIRHIILFQATIDSGAASSLPIQVFRLTSAGTGGTAITPQKYDNGDAAAGATAMTIPSAKGTEAATMLMQMRMPAQLVQPLNLYGPVTWVADLSHKSIIIPAGTTNGIALKVGSGVATAVWDITVEFVERNFS